MSRMGDRRDEDASVNQIPRKLQEISVDGIISRITVTLLLYITGSAILLQVLPKIILDSFDGDHAKASQFNGWLSFGSNALQFFTLPAVAALSDTFGRRPILCLGLVNSIVVAFVLGLTVGNLPALIVCQLFGGLCVVVLPMSQAIISDTMRKKPGGGLAHGFGIVSATFGLGLSIGPLFGGILSSMHRSAACFTVAGLSTAALAVVQVFRWPETAGAAAKGGSGSGGGGGSVATAPPSRDEGDEDGVVGEDGASLGSDGGPEVLAAEENIVVPTAGRINRRVNPVAALKVLSESRTLTGLALAYSCFILSLDAWSVVYILLSYRYGWDPLRIGAFFSFFGLLLAASQSVFIRFLVPRFVSERAAVPLGMLVQAAAGVFYGLATRGWMFYLAALVTCLYVCADPCMQAIMARQVCPRRQGVLLGALTSLRTICQAVGAPLYGAIFSWSISDGARSQTGSELPGMPFFVASGFSVAGAVVAWVALRNADVAGKKFSADIEGLQERGPTEPLLGVDEN